jgi:hypothetical protein
VDRAGGLFGHAGKSGELHGHGGRPEVPRAKLPGRIVAKGQTVPSVPSATRKSALTRKDYPCLTERSVALFPDIVLSRRGSYALSQSQPAKVSRAKDEVGGDSGYRGGRFR